MSLKEQHLYEFGEFVLDTSERQLWRGEETVSIPPKAVETLCLLVENHGKLMSKDFLMDELWADSFVEDRNLAQNIFTLRKALGEDNDELKFIETVPKRGYRFVAEVRPIEIVQEELIEVSLADETTITAEGNLSSKDLAETVQKTAETLANNQDPTELQIIKIEPKPKAGTFSKISPLTISAISFLMFLTIGASIYFLNPFDSDDLASQNNPENKSARSIAVMPFINESGDREIEYLSDGMTETLINSLSEINDLSVKSRSSVFRYKGQKFTPKKIGSELGVEIILLGTIVRRGNDLILNVELIDTKTENAIWGKRFEQNTNNPILLQSEIAKSVTDKLEISLSIEDEKKLVKKHTTNPEAYRAYLKGRYYWNKRTGESIEKGIDYFDEAVELDPKYALAWSGLADSYLILPIYSESLPKVAMPKAKSAAQKAIALDPNLAEAHSSFASILHGFDWDFVAAEKEFRRAIEINPKYATARQWYSEYLNTVGKHEAAIKEAKVAQELEPLNLVMNIDVAVAFHFARRFSESTKQFKHILEVFPDYADGRFGLAMALAHQSEFESAIKECNKAIEMGGTKHNLCLSFVYAKSGDRMKAIEILSNYKGTSNEDEYTRALVYALLEERDKAFLHLERLFERRYVGVLGLKVQPEFDSLREDQRYREMVEKIGFPN